MDEPGPSPPKPRRQHGRHEEQVGGLVATRRQSSRRKRGRSNSDVPSAHATHRLRKRPEPERRVQVGARLRTRQIWPSTVELPTGKSATLPRERRTLRDSLRHYLNFPAESLRYPASCRIHIRGGGPC